MSHRLSHLAVYRFRYTSVFRGHCVCLGAGETFHNTFSNNIVLMKLNLLLKGFCSSFGIYLVFKNNIRVSCYYYYINKIVSNFLLYSLLVRKILIFAIMIQHLWRIYNSFVFILLTQFTHKDCAKKHD